MNIMNTIHFCKRSKKSLQRIIRYHKCFGKKHELFMVKKYNAIRNLVLQFFDKDCGRIIQSYIDDIFRITYERRGQGIYWIRSQNVIINYETVHFSFEYDSTDLWNTYESNEKCSVLSGVKEYIQVRFINDYLVFFNEFMSSWYGKDAYFKTDYKSYNSDTECESVDIDDDYDYQYYRSHFFDKKCFVNVNSKFDKLLVTRVITNPKILKHVIVIIKKLIDVFNQ